MVFNGIRWRIATQNLSESLVVSIIRTALEIADALPDRPGTDDVSRSGEKLAALQELIDQARTKSRSKSFWPTATEHNTLALWALTLAHQASIGALDAT